MADLAISFAHLPSLLSAYHAGAAEAYQLHPEANELGVYTTRAMWKR